MTTAALPQRVPGQDMAQFQARSPHPVPVSTRTRSPLVHGRAGLGWVAARISHLSGAVAPEPVSVTLDRSVSTIQVHLSDPDHIALWLEQMHPVPVPVATMEDVPEGRLTRALVSDWWGWRVVLAYLEIPRPLRPSQIEP